MSHESAGQLAAHAKEPEQMEWMVELALKMMQIGVSEAVTRDLLAFYPLDRIERQILFLPYRSAKKPVSLLVASIKEDYEPPANFPADELPTE